jgi:hypothetical protein
MLDRTASSLARAAVRESTMFAAFAQAASNRHQTADQSHWPKLLAAAGTAGTNPTLSAINSRCSNNLR